MPKTDLTGIAKNNMLNELASESDLSFKVVNSTAGVASTAAYTPSENLLSFGSADNGKIAATKSNNRVITIPIDSDENVKDIFLVHDAGTSDVLIAWWEFSTALPFPNGGALIISSLELEIKNE